MKNQEIIQLYKSGLKKESIAKAFYKFWRDKDKTLTEKDSKKHVEEVILKWWNYQNKGSGKGV